MPRDLAEAIVAKITPKAEDVGPDEEKKMADEHLEFAASRLIEAIKKGMATEVAKCFKELHEICCTYPEEEEGDEMAGEEGGAKVEEYGKGKNNAF